MTRDRANNYDEKKQLILRKAAALFASRGYEITTMMDVAKACNASKSHLYHYFPAKEDLLYAMLHEHTQMLAGELSEVIDPSLPAIERFQQFVRVFVDVAAEYRNEHLVLSNDLMFLPPAKAKRIREMETTLVTMLIDILREINPALVSERQELEGPYALLLFGMIIWTFTWYRKSGSIKPEELADRISDLYLNGFARARSSAGAAAASLKKVARKA